jgi:hypothetical protein
MIGAKPTLIAYGIRERGKGKKDFFIRIGAAWPFEKGKTGFSVQLDALPLDGRILLCEPKDDKTETEAEPQADNGGAQ